MINKEIVKIITEEISEGVVDTYVTLLLGVYHGHEFVNKSNEKSVLEQSEEFGILEVVDGKIIWLVPLLQEENTKKDPFDWVEREYVPLFAPLGKAKNKKECLTRMRKLFSENPEVRKEDVLAATENYINSTNPKFVRMPHYFIQKGVGSAKTQDILDWIENLPEEDYDSSRDVTRKLL